MKRLLLAATVLCSPCIAWADNPYTIDYLPSSYTPAGPCLTGEANTCSFKGGLNPSFTNVYTGTNGPQNAALWIQQSISGAPIDTGSYQLNHWQTIDTTQSPTRNAFTILYGGAQATAVMSITSDNVLTLEAPRGTVVATFDLLNIDTTVSLLVADINSTVPDFLATQSANVNTTFINLVSEQDVTTTYTALYSAASGQHLGLDLREVTGWSGSRIGLNNSVTIVNPPTDGSGQVVAEYSRVFMNANYGGVLANPLGVGGGLIAGCTVGKNNTGYVSACEGIELDLVMNSAAAGIDNIVGISAQKQVNDAAGLGLSAATDDIAFRVGVMRPRQYNWLVGFGLGTRGYWAIDQQLGRLFWAPASTWATILGGPNVGQPYNQVLHGFDIEEAIVLGCAWRSNGVCITDSGSQGIGLGVGQGLISQDGANLSIDVPGSQVTAVAVNAAGSGYIPGRIFTYPLSPGQDGVFNIGVSSGALIGSPTIRRAPIVYGATPCTTACAIVERGRNTGAGGTVNLTWRAPGIVEVAKSGVDTEIGTNGLVAGSVIGFLGLPSSTAIPIGVPTHAAFGPLCEINVTTGNLNCYYGSAWHHIAFSANAG